MSNKLHRTRRYNRHTFGNSGAVSEKNILSVAFGFTKIKRPRTGFIIRLLAETTMSDTAATVYTQDDLLTTLDVPRAIQFRTGGTVADVPGDDIVVVGTNVEGKVVTENVTMTENGSQTLTTSNVFKTIISITIPQFDGPAGTMQIGDGNRFALDHRTTANTVFKVVVNDGGTLSIEDPASDVNDDTDIEANYITLTTSPDADKEFTVYYYDPTWHLNPLNDNPTPGV